VHFYESREPKWTSLSPEWPRTRHVSIIGKWAAGRQWTRHTQQQTPVINRFNNRNTYVTMSTVDTAHTKSQYVSCCIFSLPMRLLRQREYQYLDWKRRRRSRTTVATLASASAVARWQNAARTAGRQTGRNSIHTTNGVSGADSRDKVGLVFGCYTTALC